MVQPAPQRAFEIVPDEDPASAPDRVGAGMLLLGLKTLSQRAVAAIADLFTLATVGSVFWLWYASLEPSIHQLIGLGMYACFVLAINFIVRR